jgi:WD40 repeat protein
MRAAILTLVAALAGAALSAPVPGPRPLMLPADIYGKGYVRSLAFDPSGRMLAVGRVQAALDGGSTWTAEVWDTFSRRPVASFAVDGWSPRPTFSPDGRLLALADEYAIRLWDTRARKELTALTDYGQRLHVWSLAFNPDGRTLAAAVAPARILLWDVRTGRAAGELGGYDLTGRVCGLGFNKEGLLAVADDRSLQLWDLKTRKPRFSARLNGLVVRSLAFSPDDRVIATAGAAGNAARLWDAATGKEKAVLRHGEAVWHVAFSRGGGMLATAGDKAVRLWDVAAGKVTKVIESGSKPSGLAFRSCGRCLAVGYEDGKVILWPVGDSK